MAAASSASVISTRAKAFSARASTRENQRTGLRSSNASGSPRRSRTRCARRSRRGARPCATSSARTAPPATSRTVTGCTTVSGRSAGAAARWCEKSCRASAPPTTALLARSRFLLQPFRDQRVHELGDVPAKQGDLAHERRRNEHVLFRWSKKKSLHLGIKIAVHAGELEFVFEVRHGAQSAQHDARPLIPHEVR